MFSFTYFIEYSILFFFSSICIKLNPCIIDSMRVWIDQDLCTGDGLCEEICPDVFVGKDDGLFYVKEGDKIFSEEDGNVGGAEGLAVVPKGQEEAVIESAEECPGECIMIEPS